MKKEKFYLGNKFINSDAAKLLLIEIVFVLLAFFIAYIGRTFVQFSIFYGWFILPISYLGYFSISSDTISFGMMVYFLTIPIIHFIVSVLFMALVRRSNIGKNTIIAAMIFYFVGVLFCIASSKHESWLFYPIDSISKLSWFGGVLVAVIFFIFYWSIFFCIIKREKRCQIPTSDTKN
jgi:hypothetical protein